MVSDSENQPLIGVTLVNDSDIICGRGGLALKHPGNMAYRKIVGLNKELYATCLKTEKLRVSKSIVAAIREINGRFLEREDGKTSSALDETDENGNPVTWRDIGDKRAIEKTSQALREGQPKLLKKLAQHHDNGIVNPMANFNHIGLASQSQMHQFSHMQPPQQNNFNPLQGGVQVQSYGVPVQNILRAQQRPSFTFAQLVEGQNFSTFPRNSFVDSNVNVRGPSQDSWHDSWGSVDPAPLPPPPRPPGRIYERTNSTISNDSWGGADPMPLPYHDREENGTEHIFSTDDQQQLMSCLGVDGGDGARNSHEEVAAQPVKKRPSVKFNIRPQRPSITAMSLSSHLSELSIFSDALSLDSAIDAVKRDEEFDMLGEFEAGEMSIGMSIGTFESPESGSANSPKLRRSILRRSNKWSNQTAAFPSAPSSNPDPGILFTSTLDITPGGVNSGTDISGFMGERRKSAVAFEVDVIKRRRSSRMSMCSALTDFSGAFKRDIGSILSIQSAEFREFMADIDDDSDDSLDGNSPP
eukprot:CAMPEP_0202007292 /NCGR_PEP_ID=MMETSP0905-20130828/11823_1 /ASSEMBLY_ACC=CAM_ASM_000554 /TAXON_ID=420261 /ORGANISM="Thalassiosira antarctica, Strain CCMP982" /LENGTH=526 /DNA_ID=CAMNT_0048565227 /DNA_START=64 /DNA_END=1644 /DNA_ORIENTATION=-